MCGDEGGHAHDGGDGGGILCALDLAKLKLVHLDLVFDHILALHSKKAR